MEVPKTLSDEIWDYCRLNNIPDIDGFMIKLLKAGFTVEKYGATPTSDVGTTNIVEKEVIKEIIIEKEVIKEVMVSDDVKVNELLDKLTINEQERHNLLDHIQGMNKRIAEYEEKVAELTKGKQNNTDIYNEKRATFGSNLLDKK